jgi:phosphate transport system substrate-binding protein
LTSRNLSDWLDRSPLLRPVVLWSLVAVVALPLLVGAGFLTHAVLGGPEPPRGNAAGPIRSVRAPDSRLLLAGSGSNVPLTRQLADACSRADPSLHIDVDEGMGSTGGLRALADGEIDLALVSRPLRDAERKLGLTVLPYARAPVAVATHPDVVDEPLTREEIVQIFQGVRARWSDGRVVVPVQRESGDSSHAAVGKRLPAFAVADDLARRDQRWLVAYHDRSMHETLLATPGSVGLVDASAVRAGGWPLRLLKVDGAAPTGAAVAAGKYPFWKDLLFVSSGRPTGAVARFLACVASPVGEAVIRKAESLPLLGGAR